MQDTHQPFHLDLVAERNRSMQQYYERLERMRDHTVEVEKKQITPQEDAVQKAEHARRVLSELEPGAPGVVSMLRVCLLDVADVLDYLLNAISSE